MDPDRLFVTIEPNEKFYFAVPFFHTTSQDVLGVAIVHFDHLPTEDDITSNTLTLISKSVSYLLLVAGFVGMCFGFLTARGMVSRLQNVSGVADAWSQGDFSKYIDDPVRDEIGQLGGRLNQMALQLKNLLKQRQEMAVSDERNRLARDLHDSAKQQALAASFQIGTALTLYDSDPLRSKTHMEEAERLVDSVRTELTDLIAELRPQVLDEKSLDEILREYAVGWSHQNPIDVHLDLKPSMMVSLRMKQTLLRILHESLANAARHSDGESVSITLRSDGEVLTLIVEDDGRGFSPNNVTSGMGLNSMKERAHSLGGSLDVESVPGEGTSIRAKIPFEQ
jgi:NarL family two-component system sensor histidine kinase LiaS